MRILYVHPQLPANVQQHTGVTSSLLASRVSRVDPCRVRCKATTLVQLVASTCLLGAWIACAFQWCFLVSYDLQQGDASLQPPVKLSPWVYSGHSALVHLLKL